jgi:hypothetical protein
MSQSYQAGQQQGGQMTTSQPQGVSGGQIPDLLKITAIPSNTQIEVETAILEPVNHSDTNCRFVLQNKGLLHSHSKLEFEFTSPTVLTATGLPTAGQLPVGVGIHGLIERATLRVGTKTICEIEDYNYFQAYKSSFLSPEAEVEREQYLTGRNGNCLDVGYNSRVVDANAQYEYGGDQDGGHAGGATPAGQQSNHKSNGLMLANGKDMRITTSMASGDLGGPDAPAYPPNSTKMNGVGGAVRDPLDETRLTRVRETGDGTGVYVTHQDLCPTWQIALSDLFPFLKTNQLPLYMMKEPVNLELVFSKVSGATGKYGCDRACGDNANLFCPIKTASTRMIADHLYYPQEMMEAYASANRSLQFQYVDYRMSKFSVDSTSLASTGIRNIGGAGRIVSKVFWGINQNATTGKNAPCNAWIQNKYVAVAPNRTYNNAVGLTTNLNGKAVFNLKMNEQFLFPIDVANSARHFHNVVQTEGMVPFLSREPYAKEGISCKLDVYDQAVQDASEFGAFGSGHTTVGVGGQYPGQSFWQAFRLNRGERVNSRGIELYFQQDIDADAHSNDVQRVWLETLRTAVLEDGILECYYA